MATINLKSPAIIKIENKASHANSFVPFGENFIVKVAAGAIIEFKVNTSNEVVYYLNQATADFVVTILQVADGAVGALVLNVPATVTLQNIGDKVIGIIPFKQNFQENIAVGDSLVITTNDVNQVLYYMAQSVEGKLSFTQEAIGD